MAKRFLILTISLACFAVIKAQDINSFLKIIAENNPEIVAYRKMLDARKVETKTGIAPPGPSFSFGYMPGRTDAPGTKKTWSVSQSFSFPAKYLLQKKINQNTVILAEQEFNLGKMNSLLEAKLMLYDLIYNKKVLEILNNRKEGYDRLKSAWEKMLANGTVTIMDFNKIMFELSSVNLRISRIETDINILGEKLLYMSGGAINLTVLPAYPEVEDPELQKLIEEKMNVHPAFLMPEMEYQISLQEVKLSRTENLPEFQAGYASERIPGEIFTGPVAGLSIPLWSNSNKVKTSQAFAEHLSAVRDAELMRLKSQVRNEFENMKAIKRSIADIRLIADFANNTRQLEKALSSEEISLSTYFMYLDSAYEIGDRLLELENEYNKSLAHLSDHELIK